RASPAELDDGHHSRMALNVTFIDSGIVDVDNSLRYQRPAERDCWMRRNIVVPQEISPCGRQVLRADSSKVFAVIEEHLAIFRLANTHRVFQHGLEHWLQLTGRRTDDFQDF